jgi:hypothetical protein
LNKKNKEYFSGFVADDKELAAEIVNKDMIFLEVLSCVKRYNQHIKEK